jgi:hypothetical protein
LSADIGGAANGRLADIGHSQLCCFHIINMSM